MNKDHVIRLFGSVKALAAAVGLTTQGIYMWRTDKRGDLLDKKACDQVLAALVRQNHAHRRANPGGSRFELEEHELEDLMRVPSLKQRAKRKKRPSTKVQAPAPAQAERTAVEVAA